MTSGYGCCFLSAFDVGNHVALVDVCTLLGVDFNKFATECSRNFKNLSVRVFDVAEEVALVVGFADEGFDALDAFAVAADFPKQRTAFGSYDGIGLACLSAVASSMLMPAAPALSLAACKSARKRFLAAPLL